MRLNIKLIKKLSNYLLIFAASSLALFEGTLGLLDISKGKKAALSSELKHIAQFEERLTELSFKQLPELKLGFNSAHLKALREFVPSRALYPIYWPSATIFALFCAFYVPQENKIFIPSHFLTLVPSYTSCVVAHELGHALFYQNSLELRERIAKEEPVALALFEGLAEQLAFDYCKKSELSYVAKRLALYALQNGKDEPSQINRYAAGYSFVSYVSSKLGKRAALAAIAKSPPATLEELLQPDSWLEKLR